MLLLSACGLPLSEREVSDTRAPLQLKDPRPKSFGFSPVEEWKAERKRYSDDIVYLPRIAAEPGAYSGLSTREWLPAATLMQVEIVLYPDISCKGDANSQERVFGDDNAPGAMALPMRIDPRALEGLGGPVKVLRIWMLPADGETVEERFGPVWLGNFMRQAGVGTKVVFPAFQDCEKMQESTPWWLAKRVFRGFSVPGVDPYTIGARTPFTAEVVEACPARIERHRRVIRQYHLPDWRGKSDGFSNDYHIDTIKVEGSCASGEHRFVFGPYASSPFIRDVHPTLVGE